MDVTFALNKETLEALKDAFTRDLAVYEGVVKDIKANLARIDIALSPVRRVQVESDSAYGRAYTVTRTARSDGYFPFTYECSCPSYQYERGLDADHRCKHIRRAITQNRWA